MTSRASAPAQASPTGPLWRVGRRPHPWAWVPWEHAGGNRWDDADRLFRTVYAGESAYACYVELLATYRSDPDLVSVMGDIHVDPADRVLHPTSPAGRVPRSWVTKHMVTSAMVTGTYCDVTAAATIAALRPRFLSLAKSFGLRDFDAAAVKTAWPRALTQHVASSVYRLACNERGDLFDGIRFASRHGDELAMWAIFERPGDEPWSHLLSITSEKAISTTNPELRRALVLHGLRLAPRE